MKKAICPFCKPNKNASRGDGCCYCDHTGFIPFGENTPFQTKEEAEKHDPATSLFDLKNYKSKVTVPNK